MYLIESMVSGVPVVQPALGAFPEIISLSGGGAIYEPNTPEMLCEKWSEVITDPEKLELLSNAGYKGTKDNFDIDKQAAKIIGLYESILR
jgi:glycosyltransferase involved in cell wall biosynthesis